MFDATRRDAPATDPPAVAVEGLTMSYDGRIVMQGIDFEVRQGEIFVVMGGSGSGKSTLLKHLVGLKRPAAGTIRFAGADFSRADETARRGMLRRMGVLFQNGALWSGLTLAENVALPIEEYTELEPDAVAEAIAQHYAPQGPADDCPREPVAVTAAGCCGAHPGRG